MTFRALSKRATIVSLFLGVLLAGSVAFAWWTAGGSGTGYAEAASPLALSTNNVSASTTADLYPGANGTLTIQIHNPNTYPVVVNTIAADPSGTPTSGSLACDAANTVSLVAPITGLSVNIAAGGDSPTLTYAGAVHMSVGATADNSCQGKKFTIPVTLTGING
jgi:hypothetical protein